MYTLLVFFQITSFLLTGKFQKFDYGLIDNMKRYGTIHPPDYNLANVKLPVYLHYGATDMFVDVQVRMLFIAVFQFLLNFSSFSSLLQDLHQLYRALPNAQKFLVPSDIFGHTDFLWGKHANVWIYNKILSLMENHKK